MYTGNGLFDLGFTTIKDTWSGIAWALHGNTGIILMRVFIPVVILLLYNGIKKILKSF